METFFLACFAIGLLFTVASLALGFVGGGLGHGSPHLGGHAPHIGGHGGHLPHAAHDVNSQHSGSLPLLNGSSAVGGLTWFGAAGYLLMRLGDGALAAALIGALGAGALGWYLVARFLGLILRGEVEMDPADYRLEGTVSQVTVSIPAGGTGEILFEKAGVRRSEAARALGGTAIPRGTEVVIASYDKGFATVQPWTEFIAERPSPAAARHPLPEGEGSDGRPFPKAEGSDGRPFPKAEGSDGLPLPLGEGRGEGSARNREA